MAKSLRSKRQQRNRRERREKYKVKELKKLKDMLTAAGEINSPPGDSVMSDATKDGVLSLKKRRDAPAGVDCQNVGQSSGTSPSAEDVQMPTAATSAGKSEYDPSTLRNRHGNYPPWMSRRHVCQQRGRKRANMAADIFKKFRRRRRVM